MNPEALPTASPAPEESWSGRPFDTAEIELVRRIEQRLDPLLRRTHLPRFPLGPLLAVVMGTTGIVMVGGLFEPAMRGPRPLAVAGVTLACAVAAPMLGLLLTGLWDLARGPLQFFAPTWYERLTLR